MGDEIVELPEEDELLIAVVKKILPYGAFCSLPEYDDLEAFLHISEVAPRWIKNIHEFLSEGQRCVVKVHHVDPKKQQVDVSIKRVSEEEKKRKLEAVQNERRATKLLEFVVKSTKAKNPEKIRAELEKHFEDLFSAFRAASYEGSAALKKVKLPEKLKEKIVEISQKSIKKPTIKVSKEFKLICYGGEGSKILKKILNVKNAEILYLGAPNYRISLVGEEYKTTEKAILKILKTIENNAHKYKCEFSYENK